MLVAHIQTPLDLVSVRMEVQDDDLLAKICLAEAGLRL